MYIKELYCDGGTIGANPSTIGITWAWVGVANGAMVAQSSGVVTAGRLTSNVAEYCAMLHALEAMPDGWSGKIYADSLLTINRFFGAWKERGIDIDLVARKWAVFNRLGKVEGVWLPGHPTKQMLSNGSGSQWNVVVDKLCTEEAAKFIAI